MNWTYLAAALAVCLAACAPRASRQSSLMKDAATPDSVQLIEVPFFPNTSDQCGPTALASLLNFWGVDVSPAMAKEDIYLPSLHGTLPMDILPALEKQGLSGRVISGTYEDIKNEIRER